MKHRPVVASIIVFLVAVVLTVVPVRSAGFVGPAAADPVFSPALPATQDWLDWFNYYRSIAGLSALTEDPSLSTDAANHATYLAGTPYPGDCSGFPHCESPANPLYTPGGARSAGDSNISSGRHSERGGVEALMLAPFHGLGMLNGSLAQTGAGYDSQRFVLDIYGSNPGQPTLTEPVGWPGDGTKIGHIAYSGNESPDPMAPCAGSPEGLPIIVQFPSGADTSAATASLTQAGSPVPFCFTDSSDYASPTATGIMDYYNAVFLLPVEKLTPGLDYTYTAAAGAYTETATFTPFASPPKVTPSLSTGANAITVSWSAPADTGGLALTGYRVALKHAGQIEWVTAGPGATSVEATGLIPGETYCISVSPQNAVSNPDEPASSCWLVTMPELPEAPQGVSAVLDGDLVRVDWNTVPAPASNSYSGAVWVERYVVTAQPGGQTFEVPVAEPWDPPASMSTLLAGLAGGAHTFTVRAVNVVGGGPQSAVTGPVVSPGPPSAPTALVVDDGDTELDVSWSVPADDGGRPVIDYTVTVEPGGHRVTTSGTDATIIGLVNGRDYTVEVSARNSVGTGPKATSAGTPEPPDPIEGRFHPLEPDRLLDTRIANTPLGPGESMDLVVTDRSGVPDSGVSAVVVNVTGVFPSAATHLTVWPTGDTMPTASNLNLVTGDVRPNLVSAKVGVDGKISIFNNSGTVDVIVDIAGYYDDGPGDDSGRDRAKLDRDARGDDVSGAAGPSVVPSGDGFVGIQPTRLADSRDGTGGWNTAFGSGQTRSLTVRDVGPVPADATSVVVNVTGVAPSAATHLTAWPSGSAMPEASNVNLSAGQVRPNLAMVKVGASGKIDVFNNAGSIHVLVDVVGYFTPDGSSAGFTPVVPNRVHDSRDPGGVRLGPGQTRTIKVAGTLGLPGEGIEGVALNVTGVFPSLATHLWVAPGPSPAPDVSNLNLVPGEVAPNMVIVQVSPAGEVTLYNNSGTVDVIVDVVGWFAA